MFKHGGLAEWFKAAVLKTVDVNSVRRFESCVLRHYLASAHDKKADAFFFASAKSNPLRSRPRLCGWGWQVCGSTVQARRRCTESCVLRHYLASAHDKKADAFFFALQSRTLFAVNTVPASICARFAPRLHRLQKPDATIWLFVLTIILNRLVNRITFWLCFFCCSYPNHSTNRPGSRPLPQTT